MRMCNSDPALRRWWSVGLRLRLQPAYALSRDRAMVFSLPVWLRKSRLARALRQYPLYDPPHKVEERLLSRERAAENFAYFMRVRSDRLAHFRQWLREQFGIKVSLDEKGMRALCRWGSKYAGLLLAKGTDGYPTGSYFTYDPPWTEENAGNNVVFDIGLALGEAIIANCPKLRWDFDPISAMLPSTARLRKQTSGMGFWRPVLCGFDNPVYEVIPLHCAYDFAFSMMENTTSVEGIKSFHEQPRFVQQLIFEQLLNSYRDTVKNYPDGDPAGLRRELGTEEYLKLVDDEANQGDHDE